MECCFSQTILIVKIASVFHEQIYYFEEATVSRPNSINERRRLVFIYRFGVQIRQLYLVIRWNTRDSIQILLENKMLFGDVQ